MHYNLTIKNTDALPIPYITKVGEAIAVDGLYSNKELHCEAIYIGATPQNQLLIHCVKVDYILELSTALEITIHAEKPISTT